MKAKWEYKTLGEVAFFQSGSRPSGGVGVLKDGALSLGGEHIGRNGRIDLSNAKYVSCEYYDSNTKGHIFEGDILLCKDGALTGKVAIERGELCGTRSMVNEHVFIIRTNVVSQWYLFYYLFSPTGQNFIRERITGSAQGGINGTQLKTIPVSYPESIQEQRRIVAELDLLTEVIDKRRMQLTELDTLAQSIFYDMFGDPTHNEKGWDVKKWEKVFRMKSGDGLTVKDFINGVYPVYGGNGISGFHNAYNKDGSYIVIGRVGAYCGNVRFVQGKFWLTDNAFELFFDSKSFNFDFLCRMLNTYDLHQYANQAAQPVISNTTLKGIDVILPPLTLQQEFADKIQSIEKQKTAVNQSIAETQKLLDYTMDKYFG